MTFARVKQILDGAIAGWQAANGAPDLSGHGPTFGWQTREGLLAAVGHGKRLIQPEVIGQPNAAQANLLVDLRVGFGNRRMPDGGPYLSDAEIMEIEDWIRAGCAG